AALARVVAIEDVGHPRGDEDHHGHPAQPQPTLQNVLPVEASDDGRYRGDAGISQQIRHRELPWGNLARGDRIHRSQEYLSRARAKRDSPRPTFYPPRPARGTSGETSRRFPI